MYAIRSLLSFASLVAIPLSLAQASYAVDASTTKVDYVIVGAGPAGYVVAETLSRNASVTVTVLEAGPDGRNDSNMDVPADLIFVSTPTYLWEYNSQPDPNLGGATPNLWQGRALGGGSAVNAMTYCRGSESVFDQWAQTSGNSGLQWSNILNDFRATTHYTNQPADYQQTVNTGVYGDGPIEVSRASMVDLMDRPFAEAYEQSFGLKEVDQTDREGIGVDLGLSTIRVSNRTRSYAANTYGYILANRKNVQVLPNSWVQKIGFSGKTARDVTYINTVFNKVTTLAGKQIILAGGAINTPQLLMLSGVGNATTLNSFKIPVVADIPAVGQNLWDHHFSAVVVQATSNVDTFYQMFQNATTAAQYQAEYARNYSGPLGNVFGTEWATYRLNDSVFDGIDGYHYTSLPQDRPHILAEIGAFPAYGTPNVSTVSAWATLAQPEASGYVTIGSSSYTDAPLIYSNYYGSAADKAAILAAYKQLRSIFESAPLQRYEIQEVFPGSSVTSDADVWKAIQQSASSFHHPMGTCAIGSVVDSRWRIKGLKNIRIVDSSTIPYLPTCHTQASVYAVAHVAAQDILAHDAGEI